MILKLFYLHYAFSCFLRFGEGGGGICIHFPIKENIGKTFCV